MAHRPQGPTNIVISLSEAQASSLDQLHRQRRATAGAKDQTSAPTQQGREELAKELLVAAVEAELA